MDAEALQAENEELAAQVEELKAESDDRAGQIEQLEEEKAALEARVEELQGAVDELEAALMVYEGIERTTKVLMETAFDRIQEALQEEIDAGKVEVFKGALGIVVDIHGEYMFDVGKVVINQTGKIILDKIAPILGELDGYFIGVVGNADNKQIVTPALKKRFGTNWELSAHRGAIVVRELIEKGNLPPAKMIAMGFGEFQPIEDNATVDGRGKNRRIDIVLMPIDVYAATVVGTQIR
jgi:flagellar motor protein MotB